MPAYEIAIEMLDDLKRDYRYQAGHWFYRSANRWRTAAPPRLVIWQAMTAAPTPRRPALHRPRQ